VLNGLTDLSSLLLLPLLEKKIQDGEHADADGEVEGSIGCALSRLSTSQVCGKKRQKKHSTAAESASHLLIILTFVFQERD
jgi:hypothetical protein